MHFLKSPEQVAYRSRIRLLRMTSEIGMVSLVHSIERRPTSLDDVQAYGSRGACPVPTGMWLGQWNSGWPLVLAVAGPLCSRWLAPCAPDLHFGGCRRDSGPSARHTHPGQPSSHRGLATILAKHSHGLRFGHSASITEGVARALAKCEGYLALDVGPSLSPSVARELVNHRAALWLSGLTCLSESNADILADHEGSLTLGCFSLTTISEAAAGALARHKGPLSLVYFDNLPASAAYILRPHVQNIDDD